MTFEWLASFSIVKTFLGFSFSSQITRIKVGREQKVFLRTWERSLWQNKFELMKKVWVKKPYTLRWIPSCCCLWKKKIILRNFWSSYFAKTFYFLFFCCNLFLPFPLMHFVGGRRGKNIVDLNFLFANNISALLLTWKAGEKRIEEKTKTNFHTRRGGFKKWCFLWRRKLGFPNMFYWLWLCLGKIRPRQVLLLL